MCRFNWLSDANCFHFGMTTRHLVIREQDHPDFSTTKIAILEHLKACGGCKNHERSQKQMWEMRTKAYYWTLAFLNFIDKPFFGIDFLSSNFIHVSQISLNIFVWRSTFCNCYILKSHLSLNVFMKFWMQMFPVPFFLSYAYNNNNSNSSVQSFESIRKNNIDAVI